MTVAFIGLGCFILGLFAAFLAIIAIAAPMIRHLELVDDENDVGPRYSPHNGGR